MSNMRDLLEKMAFAGQAVGQTPGDQVRGTEKARPSKKGHPFKGRLVGDGGTDESVEQSLRAEYEQYLAEYGAPGSGIGNDTARNPAEEFALGQQRNAQKNEIKGQIGGLTAQLAGARGQIAQLNRAFPQGANPVEKAMSLRDTQAQKVAIQGQIEDLTSQIAALRTQAI